MNRPAPLRAGYRLQRSREGEGEKMPCDTVAVNRGITTAERARQIQAALASLEAGLASGAVKAVIGAQGGIAFNGQWARDGVSDVCAYRRLLLKGSGALRMAVQRAELQAGRKLNPQAIGSGLHSHDGGNTWSRD